MYCHFLPMGTFMRLPGIVVVLSLFLIEANPCRSGNRFPSRDCSPTCCKEIWDPAHPTGMITLYQCVTGSVVCKLACRISCARFDDEGGAAFTCSRNTQVPNPVPGNEVEIYFAGSAIPALRMTVDVYSSAGKKIGMLWSGVPSEQPVRINTEQLGSDVYFLVLSDANGVRADARKMIVNK